MEGAASMGLLRFLGTRRETGQSATSTRTRRLCVVAGLTFFLAVSALNAWVSEDAYITLRSVEQVFAGNGPRWNPHERVQAFTHPLWFGVLVVARVVSRDVFLNGLVASFACSLAAVLVLGRWLGFGGRWLVCVLLLGTSRGWVDFSSCGLEGPLSFLLLAVFVVSFLAAERAEAEDAGAAARSVRWFSFLLALCLCNRHDLAPLLLPAVAWVAWRRRGIGWRRVARAVVVGLVPFWAWTAFSLWYYGFPFPNTAYAKLSTGVAATELFVQGLTYLWSDLLWDPITLGVILLTVVASAFGPSGGFRALSLGLLLRVVYVVSVGGDFMHGRFWTEAFFVAVPVLVEVAGRRRVVLAGLATACAVVVAFQPHAPIRTSPAYVTPRRYNRYGIADERAYYARTSTLWRWLRWDPGRDGAIFPLDALSLQGAQLAVSPTTEYTSADNVGYLGYWAGTEDVVVDTLALADPLLARLPCERPWRIGHFRRRLPEGYLESLSSGANRIADPDLARFYDELCIVTQGRLWSLRRLKAILAMNVGWHNGLLDNYTRTLRQGSTSPPAGGRR